MFRTFTGRTSKIIILFFTKPEVDDLDWPFNRATQKFQSFVHFALNKYQSPL